VVLPCGGAPRDVAAGAWAAAHAGQGDGVYGPVECSASLRTLPGWEKLTTVWAALTGPTPGRSVRPGAITCRRSNIWARLAFSALEASRRAKASRRSSPWRTRSCGWVVVGHRRPRAPPGRVGEGAAGGVTILVVAGEQQRT